MVVVLVVILAMIFFGVVHSPDQDDPDKNYDWDIVEVPNGTATPKTTSPPKESQHDDGDGLDRAYKIMNITICCLIIVVVLVAVGWAVLRGQPLDLENGPFAMPLRLLQQLRGYINGLQERRAIRALR